jgi:hypothetical protein
MPPSTISDYLNFLFRQPAEATANDKWIQTLMPRRSLPLRNPELSLELSEGPVCVLVFEKSFSRERLTLAVLALAVALSLYGCFQNMQLFIQFLSTSMTFMIFAWPSFSVLFKVRSFLSIGGNFKDILFPVMVAWCCSRLLRSFVVRNILWHSGMKLGLGAKICFAACVYLAPVLLNVLVRLVQRALAPQVFKSGLLRTSFSCVGIRSLLDCNPQY